MARAWLIDSRGFATKVKNAALSSATQIKDCGANRECPKCHYLIDNSDVLQEWPGLPIGVKFDPSDVELLGHLASKCGVEKSKPHVFIDEFIPTVEKDEGICYTHPERLPGAKKDGSSIHFFYKTTNAYATGRRKRRRIEGQDGLEKDNVRWHKTGKTRPVLENGVQIGWKKIMVLHKTSKKGSKPAKSNWVMYQYHLGTDEDEKEGQYVVSKIYHQQKQTENNRNPPFIEEPNVGNIQAGPTTPITTMPDPHRPGKSVSCDDDNVLDDYLLHPSSQIGEIIKETIHPNSSTAQIKDEVECSTWLAGESQAVNGDGMEDSLLCNEFFYSCVPLGDSGPYPGPFSGFAHNDSVVTSGETNIACGIDKLGNLEFDTSPDFQLADLQFGSQDSILGWLDRI